MTKLRPMYPKTYPKSGQSGLDELYFTIVRQGEGPELELGGQLLNNGDKIDEMTESIMEDVANPIKMGKLDPRNAAQNQAQDVSRSPRRMQSQLLSNISEEKRAGSLMPNLSYSTLTDANPPPSVSLKRKRTFSRIVNLSRLGRRWRNRLPEKRKIDRLINRYF